MCVCVSEWPGSGKPVGSLTTAQDGRVVGSFPVKLICFNSAQFFFGDFHFFLSAAPVTEYSVHLSVCHQQQILRLEIIQKFPIKSEREYLKRAKEENKKTTSVWFEKVVECFCLVDV